MEDDKKIIFELSRLTDFSDESLLNELKRVSELTNNILTTSEFRKYAKVSCDVVRRRFGSWEKALAKAGLENRYSGTNVSEKMKTQKAKGLSESELLTELNRVSSLLEKDELSQQDFNEHSEYSASAITRRFGSWSKGLSFAGLKEVKMAKRYSEHDYFENLLNVWMYYGRQPKYNEMDKSPSIISSGGYEKKWGKWSTALVSFIDYVNKNESIKEEPTVRQKEINPINNNAVLKENNRNISLGLRYKVLSRDRFKCVKCGNSPASDIQCRLHIDHIIPFSKGGMTIIDNLQTTCEECNLGKGNRYEE